MLWFGGAAAALLFHTLKNIHVCHSCGCGVGDGDGDGDGDGSRDLQLQ